MWHCLVLDLPWGVIEFRATPRCITCNPPQVILANSHWLNSIHYQVTLPWRQGSATTTAVRKLQVLKINEFNVC